MQPGSEQTDDTRRQGRPWLGLLLSILVPGFGLYRAGCVRRAVVWFLALQLMNLFVGLAFALESIPVQATYAVRLANGIAFIWMLCSSFKEGRMTLWRTILFLGLLGALILLPAPGRWVVRIFRIPTTAMEPTLRGPGRGPYNELFGGNHIAVSRIAYWFNPVKRGDIIAFQTRGIAGVPQDQLQFRRVVGLPGEAILIKEGSIYINERKMTQTDGIPPITYRAPQNISYTLIASGDAPYIIPRGTFFVLGDNSVNSIDSRFWGCVPAENIYGKCTKVLARSSSVVRALQ